MLNLENTISGAPEMEAATLRFHVPFLAGFAGFAGLRFTQ